MTEGTRRLKGRGGEVRKVQMIAGKEERGVDIGKKRRGSEKIIQEEMSVKRAIV